MSTNGKQTIAQLEGEMAAIRTEELHSIAGTINDAFGWRLDPEEAVVKYLVERHHWLPRDVRAMSLADLLLCLSPLDLKSAKST